MYIQLVREDFTDTSTEGKMFINGTFECHTLEDCDRFLELDGQKVYGKTCIPRGTYDIIITKSNRFKKNLPLLIDVPQFKGIRIHAGNTSRDTEGCILVGRTNGDLDDDFIGNSKDAFRSLMPKIKNALDSDELVTIEIV